jgi:hypothetical protein
MSSHDDDPGRGKGRGRHPATLGKTGSWSADGGVVTRQLQNSGRASVAFYGPLSPENPRRLTIVVLE